MKSFKQLKEQFSNQMVFFIMAIVMVILTVSLSIYLLTFLISNLGQVFAVNIQPTPSQQFDTRGFETLHLVQ